MEYKDAWTNKVGLVLFFSYAVSGKTTNSSGVYCIRWDLHPEYPLMEFHLQPIARKIHEQIQLRFGFYALMPLQSFYHRKVIDLCNCIGLVLMHKIQIKVVFDRVFFLQLAREGISLGYSDIPSYTRDELDQDILSLTFAYDVEELGSIKTIELCPKGKDIVVNS
ncbi:hypothetical protein H5410_035665 [Solanum commersonii]|uniref:HECT-type E3 ubiquitin transferase n=1 Tax=Solanum commersonii TaxID=4109 RepID=A0A9J5Y1X6_SOLCO|nr:hypothetical protein H5410_035665 [Solanum commersonii]